MLALINDKYMISTDGKMVLDSATDSEANSPTIILSGDHVKVTTPSGATVSLSRLSVNANH
jgi:hypothetical protein